MREYMNILVGCTVLSALSQLIAPEKWRKYLKIVTGLIIMNVIISPIYQLSTVNFFNDFSLEEQSDNEIDLNIQKKQVIDQLEENLQGDIVARIKDEFNMQSKAVVELSVNDAYEIIGVLEVKLWVDKNREQIRKRISEVYSPQKISFQNP